MTDRLTEAGAQIARPSKYAPIFVAASLTGLYTQRNVFHDPSNVVTQRFYGGRPDTLFNGLNVELSNELTLIRRFGTSQFSGATYPQPPTTGFSFELNDGSIRVLIDTPSFVYWDEQNGSKTTIFTKALGAGQGYFVSSGDTLYYGDGVDLLKYTPGNPNGTVWNWGIVAPVNPPTINIVESGSSSVSWQANTYFTTMGLLFDGTNIQQLYTVNANSTNPNSQFGTSSNGQPAWNQNPGGTTTDGSVTWTNQGAIGPWIPNHTYQSGQCIWVQIGSIVYLFVATHNFPTTSGASPPNWNTALMSTGARTSETNAGGSTAARWGCLGAIGIVPSMVQPWVASTVFNQYIQPSSGSDATTLNCTTIEPTLVLPPAAGQTIYLQGATTAGTTGSGTTPPTWATTAGLTTNDGQLGWRMVSGATWQATTGYTPWFLGATVFGVVKVTVSAVDYFQVCTVGGTTNNIEPSTTFTLTAASNASGGNTTYTGTFSPTLTVGYPVTITGFTNSGNNVTGKVVSCNATTLVLTNPTGVAETHAGTATFNPWQTSYGATTTDGTVTWTCVGPATTWAANSIWYLPAVGFAAPSTSQPYGGASVVANGDVQYVIASGISGGSAPSWGAVGTTTVDNTVTWYTLSAFTAQSLSWTKGFAYAYSYEDRLPNDAFNTTAPPGVMNPLGPYLGGGTGAVSTASPPAIITGSNTGAVNTISGVYSADPQVDTIDIWRSADGGGSDNMFLLTKIPNIPSLANTTPPTFWQFQDFLPSVATAQFPGLNELIPAPIDHQNDPPPAGFRPLCDKLHFSRIWGAVGNTLFFSGGPDVITGNPNEAFNPVDDFPFQSTVIAAIHTPTGLICPTTTDFEVIYGGPSTASFYDTTMLPGVGMLSYNAWDIFGGEILFLSSDSQFWTLNPATQLARIGFPIGDKIAAMNAAAAYVTVHEAGTDNAVYLGDGSTGWYRMNPHQVGADMSGENVQVWSPQAVITGGCQMLISLETAPGIKQLLIGGTGTNQHIQKRDQTVFSDSGTPYESWYDIGAITMVYPGQRAAVKFIEFDFEQIGTQPLTYYVIDDPTPNPNWTLLGNLVFDPPIMFGGANITPPYWPDRYYPVPGGGAAPGGGGIQNVRVQISSAQLKAAGVTPVPLIPAQGPNLLIVPLAYSFQYNFVTTEYGLADIDPVLGHGTTVADVRLSYMGSPDGETLHSNSSNFQGSNFSPSFNNLDPAKFVNQAFQYADLNDPSTATGDGTVTINVQFYVLNVVTGQIVGGNGKLHSAMVQISTAAYKNAHTTPIQLIPAPGGNQMLVPVSLVVWHHFNTAAINLTGFPIGGYGTAAADVLGNQGLGFIDSNGWKLAGDSMEQETGGPVDGFSFIGPTGDGADPAKIVGQAFSWANTADISAATGDTTATAYIQYMVIDVSTGEYIQGTGALFNSLTSLTASQIKNAGTTGITVIPAPGANLMLVELFGICQVNFVSQPYTSGPSPCITPAPTAALAKIYNLLQFFTNGGGSTLWQSTSDQMQLQPPTFLAPPNSNPGSEVVPANVINQPGTWGDFTVSPSDPGNNTAILNASYAILNTQTGELSTTSLGVLVGRRIRLKVDYGNTDTVRNELISFAIFGRKYVEQ